MTKNELMAIADRHYPDGLIGQCWDAEAEWPSNTENPGDTLALFVARELNDTFDGSLTDSRQLARAADYIRRARCELNELAKALDAEATKKRRKENIG